MKILLIDVYNYNKGGAETVCFNTGKLLEEHGHQVVYFTLKWKNNNPSPYEKYFPESKETRRGLFRNVINLRNYFYYPDAARKLEQLIKDEGPDLAHIHLMWGQISPSIFPVLKDYHVPVVFTIHDYRIVCPAYCFVNGFGNVCENCTGRFFYRCVTHKCCKGSIFLSLFMAAEQYFRNKFYNPSLNIDGLLYVSNFSRQKHEQYMPALKNIPYLVLHNFSVDIQSVGHYPYVDKYFLFLGRLSEEKGISTLVRAFGNIPECRLKILGTGPLEQTLKTYRVEHRLDNVEFLGYKSGQELIDLKRKAYCVIVPSECYENNPMAIIEAYAEGVPVIGAKIGGIPEIIREGETGYFFEPKDVNALSALIGKVSKMSDEEYKRMSDNAIAFAKEGMSKNRYYKRLLPFYELMLKSKDKS